jgi:hypothetical protein
LIFQWFSYENFLCFFFCFFFSFLGGT